MIAGTCPSGPPEGAPALLPPAPPRGMPTFHPNGRQTCADCQVTWVGTPECWVCGQAPTKPAQPYIYVIQDG